MRPEESLHVAVVDFLALALPADAVAFHVPNGELRNPAVARKLARMGVVPGIPDLAVVHQGRALFLELKAGKGRLSPSQRAMHSRLEAAGASVATVKSLDEAADALTAWGVPLRARLAA